MAAVNDSAGAVGSFFVFMVKIGVIIKLFKVLEGFIIERLALFFVEFSVAVTVKIQNEHVRTHLVKDPSDGDIVLVNGRVDIDKAVRMCPEHDLWKKYVNFSIRRTLSIVHHD